MPSQPTRADFYADPVVYDILHQPGTKEEVAYLERIINERLPRTLRNGAVLEPACGTGRVLLALARTRPVVGFDLSGQMVEYARRRAARTGVAKKCSFFAADMRSFEGLWPDSAPRPVALACNLINSIRHLENDRDMLAHFAQVAAVLAPGGVYAVGIHISAYGDEPPTEDVWSGSRGKVRVTQVVNYIPPTNRRTEAGRAERVISHMTISGEGGTGKAGAKRDRHVDSSYALRAYDLPQWETLIGRSALRIDGITDSSGEDAQPDPMTYRVFLLKAR